MELVDADDGHVFVVVGGLGALVVQNVGGRLGKTGAAVTLRKVVVAHRQAHA